MVRVDPNAPAGNYFALPRLLRKLRGENAKRSEGNWMEAYFVGIIIYLISYLFFAQFLVASLRPWALGPALLGLVFAMWIFWLLALYVNSLVVKLCWVSGLFTDLSANRVQSVLIVILTSAFAAQLMTAGPWTLWIGIIWIAAVALNLSAALLLALFHEDQIDSE